MGAWIEITSIPPRQNTDSVAPLVGAWIEISLLSRSSINLFVAPLVGAWIEMDELMTFLDEVKSLPSWERGLKSMGM